MAQQINSKLSSNQTSMETSITNGHAPLVGTSHQQSNESVDLDNLFAFLSEVTPNTSNTIIDDIGEKMDSLVQDLDVELENVIQQEIEGLQLDKPSKPISSKISVPSMPPPTMPPPPPPVLNGTTVTPPILPVSKPMPTSRKQHVDEPIYEAVIPRHEDHLVLPELPEVPMHHMADASHKLRYIFLLNYVRFLLNFPLNHHLIYRPKSSAVQTIRSASPVQRTNSSGGPMSPSSPKHSRPSSRASSTGQGGHPFGHAEREQRRKHRVEKKLQEMQQIDVSERERDAVRDDMYFDILEFAENHFNTHERSPEGTIMATLTRKGRKSVDMVPKYEMITYYRGNTIPSSHIHMYDPENVTVACNIFRDLCKYARGELNSERELQVIQYIIGQGIEREELRDEIFVQCMRQATNNPHSEWTDRVWLLMCLTIVAFQPSKLLIRYKTFLFD